MAPVLTRQLKIIILMMEITVFAFIKIYKSEEKKFSALYSVKVDCEIRSSDYALLDIFASYVQEIVNRLPMSNMTFHPAHFDETLCSIAHKHEYDTRTAKSYSHILFMEIR